MPLKMSSKYNSEMICPVLKREVTERKTALATTVFGEPKEELLHRWKQKVLFSVRAALMNRSRLIGLITMETIP